MASELLKARPLSSLDNYLVNSWNSLRVPSTVTGAFKITDKIAWVAQALLTICLAKNN